MANRSNDDNIAVSRGALRRTGLVLLGALGLVILAVAAASIAHNLSSKDTLGDAIDSGTYQYVYLTNGESYFGKLTAPGGDFYYMRQVYTLTAQTTPKSGKPLQHTLVKLTDELHGPQDFLAINKSQIVYMENLNPSGCAALLIRQAGPCK